MAQSASTINLQAWDNELVANNADFQKLYNEMLQASKDTSMENVEILWRLAKITYLVSLNALEPKEIKEKTQEVALYAEKAINLDANHFQANLWQASAIGKLALLYDIVEDDLQQKLKSFAIFLKHLYICIKLNPQDPMVLYMEGRMHLALLLLSPEEKVAMEQHLNAQNLSVPVLDLASAEAKLRKSIELNPNSIDSYITLAYLMVSCKKYAEAHEFINKGLAVRRVTKSDEALASDLEQLKSRLPPN